MIDEYKLNNKFIDEGEMKLLKITKKNLFYIFLKYIF